jgi:DNA-directed RNA polymerase specialized sigma24 family protein
MAARDEIADCPARRFPTTSWTMVAAAGHNTSNCAAALGASCSAYWLPLYAFVRKKGYSREDSEDLTQAFFARVLDHGVLSEARRERGRFRSFLLASVTHFLTNEWDRSQAQKRGGGCAILSFDFVVAEENYGREPANELTPEALFERKWAFALLQRVLARHRDEYVRRGQAAHFDALKIFITGDQDRRSYREAAAALDMSDAAMRTAVHRLRRRYAELVREEIARTVADPEEVDAEIRFLLSALEGRNSCPEELYIMARSKTCGNT